MINQSSTLPARSANVSAFVTIFSILLAVITSTLCVLIQPVELPALFIGACTYNGAIAIRYVLFWLVGRLDTFDPLTFLGLVGVPFFLIGPIVQYGSDYWPFIPPLTNDGGWLTIWAVLNSIGLSAFVLIVGISSGRGKVALRPWRIDYKVFWPVAVVALLVCAAVQIIILVRFGGISGFIAAFSERQELRLGRTEDDPFKGFGLPMLIAESFKYVFAMSVLLFFKSKNTGKSLPAFLAFMVVIMIVSLIFGGLRGSRSSTVFTLIFAAGMYHFWIRRIPIGIILAGIVFLVAFVNTYYWYKAGGLEGIAAINDESARSGFSASRQNAGLFVLVRDFGRMDVQSLAMKQFSEKQLKHVLGATYLAAPFTIIPNSLVPWKPEALARAKSDIVFGPGHYSPDGTNTTIVLGMCGEGFINFGYAGFLLPYLLLGWFVARVRAVIRSVGENDLRRLVLPVFCLLPPLILFSDAGLVIMVLARALLIPAIVLFLSRTPVRIGRKAQVAQDKEEPTEGRLKAITD